MARRTTTEEVNGWTVESDTAGKAVVWNAYKLDADGFVLAQATLKPGCHWAFDTKREALLFAKTN